MIRQIKTRFIALSMAALLVLLAVIVTGMNVINYNSVIADADETLSLMSKNSGRFPELGEKELPKHMTPETPYESRYFSVLLDENNSVVQTDTSRITAIDPNKAIEYAAKVASSGKEAGFAEKYRFLCYPEGGCTRIVFLDCGREIDDFRTFLTVSVLMALAGYAGFFFVILFFSGRIIRPVTESYEKQRRFITDAGHEIKTPLTIIQADADVLEMDLGENEWLEDIRKQTRRLADLTNDLVYLSRMEESANTLQMIEFPLSDVVSETAASFQALAQTQHKLFTLDIQPMLSLVGDERSIRQLVNILLDNALKYSPEEGSVSVSLLRQGRCLRLTVRNTVREPVPKDQLPHLFERFYRVDASRSARTGGYGIGLSVAKAIVTAHSGRITASTPSPDSLEMTVQLPG